ncbi:hypothetical protein FS749_015735 [Ceratobasidium sp. UAMH 11750]|nr:hypothetical protein FS749_015735 [Ceratobasidium sp. UAMH 11750]
MSTKTAKKKKRADTSQVIATNSAPASTAAPDPQPKRKPAKQPPADLDMKMCAEIFLDALVHAKAGHDAEEMAKKLSQAEGNGPAGGNDT